MAQPIRSTKQLGNFIRNKRKDLKLSQKAFAERCGTFQPTISALENGSRGVSTELVFDVLAFLDMELEAKDRADSPSASIEDLF